MQKIDSDIIAFPLLEEGNKQYANSLNLIPALIAYVGRDLKYKYVNQAYEKWSNKEADQIIGRTVLQVLGEDMFTSIKAHLDAVLSGKQIHFENAMYNKQGLRYLDVFLTPDFDEMQQVKGYTVLINDITDKKETEKELAQKNDELKDYIENAPIGLHWVNADGIITWANKAELEMLGYASEEYIGHHISEFHTNKEVIDDILTRLGCNETLNQYPATLQCKDGSVKHVIINSNVLWKDDKFIHTRCFTLDVTEKKIAEEKLQKSQEHYTQLLEGLPVAVYTCDEKGFISFYNKTAIELWGREPQPGIDQWCGSWRIFESDGSPVALDNCPMAIALKEGSAVFGHELIIGRLDGSKRFVIPYPQPIVDEKGKIIGAVNVVVDITDRKQAEQALKEREANYHQLIQGLPVAVYTCDAQGHIMSFNKAAAVLWGCEPKIGYDLWCGSWKIYNPVDGSPMALDTCPMAIALKEGRVVVGEEIIVERPDGTRRYVTPYPQPIFDDLGKIVGAINTLIDVTEQKRVEQTIRESEQRFRIMADQAPIVIWMTDAEGNCTYVNSTWSKLTGKESVEGLGAGWMEHAHPEDKEVAYTEWKKASEIKSVFDFKLRYNHAEFDYIIARVTGTPRYNEAGEFVGYIGILDDITLQENATLILEREVKERTKKLLTKNEELRRSEERYNRMVDEIQDYSIILLSKEGIVQNWNKGAEKIKGYKAEEAIGKNFRMFYQEEDQQVNLPEALIQEAMLNGKSNHEGWRVKKDGSKFWGYIVITALHNETNQVIGFTKITRDLTDIKNAQDKLRSYTTQLEQQNKRLEMINSELASFAYICSHDLKEPLRKIQTFSSRIEECESTNLTDRGKDFFKRIKKASSRMQSLIEDLLAYSHMDAAESQFENVDLNKVLKQVKYELKEKIEVKQASIGCSSLPQVTGIYFQLRQLFTNLLSNSIKFSKEDVPPQIVIQSDIVEGHTIGNSLIDPNKNYHRITITDNGIGFSIEFKLKIFEVFQRLHSDNDYPGTGIGLAICKKIADNHNGLIEAEAEVNKGAVFSIYIPE